MRATRRMAFMRQMMHKEKKTYGPVRYGEQVEILPVMTPKRIARFHAKVDRSGLPDECQPWLGGRNAAGYGLMQGSTSYVGFSFLAHRIAWALARNAEPGALVIRHSCDNPPCCNPLHLLSGTYRDNYNDMVERGRHAHVTGSRGRLGANANAADYSQEQRDRAARLRYVERWRLADIAAEIGCHRSTIARWLKEVDHP